MPAELYGGQAIKNRINPHDRYFRAVLSQIPVAREFLEIHLPERVKGLIDWSSLAARKESFVDDKLKMQVADMLYSVTIEGQPAIVYCLIEHASTPHKELPFRLFKYMVAVMEAEKKKNGTLPLVYPLALYTGARKFNHSMNWLDLFGDHKDLAQEILTQPFPLVDINTVSDEALKRRYHYFAAAALAGNYVHEPDVANVVGVALALACALEAEGVVGYTTLTLRYFMEAGSAPDAEAFMRQVVASLPGRDQEGLMRTMADHWKEEGRQAGHQAGLQEGLQEGLLKGAEKGRMAGRQEGLQAGISKGIEKIEQIARKLLEQGMTPELVSSTTGLNLEKVNILLSKP